MTKHDSNRRSRILELQNADFPVATIALKTEVSQDRVYQIFREESLQSTDSRIQLKLTRQKQIVKYLEDGESLRTIAAKLSISVAGIDYIIRPIRKSLLRKCAAGCGRRCRTITSNYCSKKCYHRDWYLSRRGHRKCIVCNETALINKAFCSEHEKETYDRNNTRLRQQVKIRQALDQCTICGTAEKDSQFRLCKSCRKRTNVRVKRKRLKERRSRIS